MRADREDNRGLIVQPGYHDGGHGFIVARPNHKAFVPDAVMVALAFGDEGLVGGLSFRTLAESFARQLDMLANTPDWDKHKKQRLKEELGNVFARGCASWFKVGKDSVKRSLPP